MIDFSKVKEGDEITVRATVTAVDLDDEEYPIRVDISVWPMPQRIVSHTPRPIEADDRVTWGADMEEYRVVAVECGLAWIRSISTNESAVVTVDSLERVI
jgi:hypothetical protein